MTLMKDSEKNLMKDSEINIEGITEGIIEDQILSVIIMNIERISEEEGITEGMVYLIEDKQETGECIVGGILLKIISEVTEYIGEVRILYIVMESEVFLIREVGKIILEVVNSFMEIVALI